MTERVTFSQEMAGALAEGRPVVALETSVLAQGLPHPHNLQAAAAMAAAVRAGGAEPAWIWVWDGRVNVGATPVELERLATAPEVAKVARRDLPMALAGGGLGATTVSATLWAADAAGIEVMATGGVGGVHPGSGDVSADLLEMARVPGTVVCSGPKSIVDPVATMERLEELGVGVIGYRSERLPFFLLREADVPLEHVAWDPEDLAGAVRARRDLGVNTALLVCNPISEEAALDPAETTEMLGECQARAAREGVRGTVLTPFLLRCLAERTDGRSLESNLALLESNARLAGQLAAIIGA